jgi:hypothetical protein
LVCALEEEEQDLRHASSWCQGLLNGIGLCTGSRRRGLHALAFKIAEGQPQNSIRTLGALELSFSHPMPNATCVMHNLKADKPGITSGTHI